MRRSFFLGGLLGGIPLGLSLHLREVHMSRRGGDDGARVDEAPTDLVEHGCGRDRRFGTGPGAALVENWREGLSKDRPVAGIVVLEFVAPALARTTAASAAIEE